MKIKVLKVVAVLLLVGFLVYLFYSPKLEFDVLENPNQSTTTKKEKTPHIKKNEGENPKLTRGVGTLMGKPIQHVMDRYGIADRIYSYQKDYKCFVFKDNDRYMLFLTKHNKVKSVYVTGEKSQNETGPIKINETASNLFNSYSINTEPEFTVKNQNYHYELSDKDIKTQSLIQFGNIYAQVFIDQQRNKVIGIRYLDKEALADINPYAQNNSSSKEVDKEDAKDKPSDQNVNQRLTLYELTNEIRKLNGRQPLKVNQTLEDVATVDLFNSGDLANTEFTESNLNDLVNKTDLHYQSVSQNVGYNFNDVPSLVHSWINSDVHRSRMLSKKYQEMGGEVEQQYYLLIFLEKGDEESVR